MTTFSELNTGVHALGSWSTAQCIAHRSGKVAWMYVGAMPSILGKDMFDTRQKRLATDLIA